MIASTNQLSIENVSADSKYQIKHIQIDVDICR